MDQSGGGSTRAAEEGREDALGGGETASDPCAHGEGQGEVEGAQGEAEQDVCRGGEGVQEEVWETTTQGVRQVVRLLSARLEEWELIKGRCGVQVRVLKGEQGPPHRRV